MNLIDYRTKHGSQSWDVLAESVGTSRAYLVQLAHGHRKASPDLARRIEISTSSEIRREDLRPDIYGPLQEGA